MMKKTLTNSHENPLKQHLTLSAIIFGLAVAIGPIGSILVKILYNFAKNIAPKLANQSSVLFSNFIVAYILTATALITYLYIKLTKKIIKEKNLETLENYAIVECVYLMICLVNLVFINGDILTIQTLIFALGVYYSYKRTNYIKEELKPIRKIHLDNFQKKETEKEPLTETPQKKETDTGLIVVIIIGAIYAFLTLLPIILILWFVSGISFG